MNWIVLKVSWDLVCIACAFFAQFTTFPSLLSYIFTMIKPRLFPQLENSTEIPRWRVDMRGNIQSVTWQGNVSLKQTIWGVRKAKSSRLFSSVLKDNLYFCSKRNTKTMTKASTVADSWVKELKCAICLEQYKEPKVLPCLHSFCKTCLEGRLPKEGLSWRVDCPSCCNSVEVS